MFIEIFRWEDDQLVLNKPQILLIPEFEDLWEDVSFLKCPEDKKGSNKLKAYQVFKYLWLGYDYKSDYMELPEEMRIETARSDAGLSKADISNLLVKNVVRKYCELQNTRLIRMLITSQKLLDKVDTFMNSIDLYEKDDNGKYVHRVKEIFEQVKEMAGVAEGLKSLEFQIKRDKEAQAGFRGDNEEGYLD